MNLLKRNQSCTPAPLASKSRCIKGVSITYNELSVLRAATTSIPERTPKRWDLISTLVSDSTNVENISPIVIVKENDSATVKLFDQTASGCKQVVHILCSKYNGIFHSSESAIKDSLLSYVSKTALKSIILLPPVKVCCVELIIIRNRPSYPLVYTTDGTYVAALFNGECRKACGKKFSHSYYQIHGRKYYFNPSNSDYFHISNQTVFATSLIADITNNISISASSFQSRAEVYNENFRQSDHKRLKMLTDFGRSISDSEHPWKITEKRIEDAWFTFSLVSFYSDKQLLTTTDFYTDSSHSQRSDLDALCGKAWNIIVEDTNPWIHHICKVKGCSEGQTIIKELSHIMLYREPAWAWGITHAVITDIYYMK